MPINNLPIEEATPQVEDILKNEEAPPVVQAEIDEVEPEIIEIRKKSLKLIQKKLNQKNIKK